MSPIDLELQALLEQGESGSVEFKTEDVQPESLAREMVAFANTLGGLLLIGVEDDGGIQGLTSREALDQRILNVARHNVVPAISPTIEWLEHEDKTLCLVRIPKGQAKPYQTLDGKFLIRAGSTNRQATKEELSRLFQASGLVHFDLSPVTGTSFQDLDPDSLHNYWFNSYQIDYARLDEAEQISLLRNADLLAAEGGMTVCSLGGLLLFGKQPQRRLPQSGIQFAVFDGTELTANLLDKKEITGPLPDLIERGVAIISLFLPKPSQLGGLRREEEDPVSIRVLREIIVNAVCHRDYAIANRRIQISLFRDRLEVSSPGRLPNTLDLKKIRYGNSAPRNFLLLKFLDNLRYIDGLGRGIPLLIRELGEGITFAEIGDIFRVSVGLAAKLVETASPARPEDASLRAIVGLVDPSQIR